MSVPGRSLPAHGVWSRYTYHGCRCELCRAENAARAARYKATGTTRLICYGPEDAPAGSPDPGGAADDERTADMPTLPPAAGGLA